MAARRKDSNNRVLKEGEKQRANGSYEFRWRDKRGERHSIYAKTLSELREAENHVVRDILDGIDRNAGSLTINEVFERWIQLKRGVKRNTLHNYCALYGSFVEKEFGKMKIANLRKTDVKAFYIHLKEKRNLKTSSVKDVHRVLRQVLQAAVDDNYLRQNPTDGAMKEIRREYGNDAEKRHALTEPQQRQLESYLRDNPTHHRWYPLFITMVWTGMRVGEVSGLRWCDVDMEKNTISINHTLLYFMDDSVKKCRLIVNSPKTECSNRTIPMLPIVKEAILLEKQMQAERGIFCDEEVEGYTDFVFLNRFGRPHEHTALNMLWKRVAKGCNEAAEQNRGDKDAPVVVPVFSNHVLRHTFATRMCEAEINIKAIQDILGHSDAETTMNIYTEATEDLKRREMEEFMEYFCRDDFPITGKKTYPQLTPKPRNLMDSYLDLCETSKTGTQ